MLDLASVNYPSRIIAATSSGEFHRIPSCNSSSVNPLSASCASFGVMAGVPSSFLVSSKAYKMAALYSSIVIIIFISFRCLFYDGKDTAFFWKYQTFLSFSYKTLSNN